MFNWPKPLNSHLDWPLDTHPITTKQVSDFPNALFLARASQGAIWVPGHAVLHELSQGKLCTVKSPIQNQIPMFLAWHRKHDDNIRLQTLIESIKAAYPTPQIAQQ